MLHKMPEEMVKVREELVPPADGDMRDSGNAWLRSAFIKSGIKRAPRENEMRIIVNKLQKAKGLCNLTM